MAYVIGSGFQQGDHFTGFIWRHTHNIVDMVSGILNIPCSNSGPIFYGWFCCRRRVQLCFDRPTFKDLDTDAPLPPLNELKSLLSLLHKTQKYHRAVLYFKACLAVIRKQGSRRTCRQWCSDVLSLAWGLDEAVERSFWGGRLWYAKDRDRKRR